MAADRPNVLWICTDQQRFDTLGCYGNGFVETPAIDGLAADGVRFDRCFSQSPICAPSRASFLTGRYPRTTGLRQNGQAIPPGETLVTKLLSEAGYACGLGGKLHLSPCNPDAPRNPVVAERSVDAGYADFHWSHTPDEYWAANEYTLWLRERGVEPGTRADQPGFEGSEYVQVGTPAEHHQTTWCVERAIDFVEASARFDEPWLFSVNPFAPHKPFNPPEAYLERYLDRLEEIPLPDYEDGELSDKPTHQDENHRAEKFGWFGEGHAFDGMDDADHRLVRAAYWAMVDLIDDQVGRLLSALEGTGQREETLVVFTSDHGELLGDHGMYLKGPFFYEPSIRVPLVVSGPGVASGVESDALVELSDLAPTLLEAAGLGRHPGMQTRSLWPLLSGESDEGREDVYCEYYFDASGGGADDRFGPMDRRFGTMVRTDRYKLVRWHGGETGELYDLEADPTETTNRWDDPGYAAARADLLERLVDRMADTVDPLPEKEAPF